jgi:hypothetical protein
MRSLGVLWSEHSEPPRTGRLDLLPDRLAFSGGGLRSEVSLGEIGAVHLARAQAERLRGLPVLVLALRAGDVVRIASLEGTGALHELSRSLAGAS